MGDQLSYPSSSPITTERLAFLYFFVVPLLCSLALKQSYILLRLRMKGHVLHRARAHLQVPG